MKKEKEKPFILVMSGVKNHNQATKVICSTVINFCSRDRINLKALDLIKKKQISTLISFHLSFLLSEHVLCKASIVIMKKFDSEILMHLYVFRYLEFIYAIFGVMHVCMCVCM